MPTLPKTIFKYEGFNVLSLQNLKAQSVYFASPLQFNDPYDCAITAQIDEPTPEVIERIRRLYLDRTDVPFNVKSQLETMTQDELKAFFVRTASKVLDGERERFLKESGVSCFSEVNNDLLMWSHYGGRYRGFCLEFRTDLAPFDKMRKVEYVDQIPKIKLLPIAVDRDPSQVVELFCTKSRAWSYEREWRGLHNQVGTLFGYEADALKGVYFGPDIERQSIEIVCLILGGQNPNVEYWRGKRSNQDFKVEFEPFTYTPHIVARQLGLV